VINESDKKQNFKDRNIIYNDMALNNFILEKTKLAELKRKNSQSLAVKIIIVIMSVIVTVFLCFMIYKSTITIEGIISVLLAFFSISISVFFYIKASETSNTFYDRSYDIMKDVSVSLGKIEERFGERLNSMNNTLCSIASIKDATKQDLDEKEKEKDKIIKDLMNASEQKGLDLKMYKARLDEVNAEAEQLRQTLSNLDTNKSNYNNYDYYQRFSLWAKYLNSKEIHRLLNGERISSENKEAYQLGIHLGFLTEQGFLTDFARNTLLHY